MIPLPQGTKIFVRPGKTDGRQGINSLSILAEGTMKENPFSGNLFLFINKRGTTRIKRLEEDRFHWPKGDADSQEISLKELEWLLDGLNLAKLKPHQEKKYSSVL